MSPFSTLFPHFKSCIDYLYFSRMFQISAVEFCDKCLLSLLAVIPHCTTYESQSVIKGLIANHGVSLPVIHHTIMQGFP